jgi:hypothetical protein
MAIAVPRDWRYPSLENDNTFCPQRNSTNGIKSKGKKANRWEPSHTIYCVLSL